MRAKPGCQCGCAGGGLVIEALPAARRTRAAMTAAASRNLGRSRGLWGRAAFAPADGASGASAGGDGGIIDVHHHFAPPALLEAMAARGMKSPPATNWTLEASLADMDGSGIGVAMVSVPNVWMRDLAAVGKLSRDVNDQIAALVARHPSRFGHFATLPLPHVEASLNEIAYALDELKADGVIINTSYENRWLGEPAFAPVLEELNRRKAVVFVHPQAPDCCVGLQPLIRDPNIEFGTDTTRAIASLVFTGAARRYPEIRFIFCHCGGTLSALVERFIYLADTTPSLRDAVPDGPVAEFRRFYYDLAQATHPIPFRAAIELLTPAQILFGTDYPYRTGIEHTNGLAGFDGLTEAERQAIRRGNVLKLLPRLGLMG